MDITDRQTSTKNRQPSENAKLAACFASITFFAIRGDS